ncbi:MAG: hypothetical protein JW808_06905 [Victivallales bacterium]|nr:hypothetical protein [Victivallales bacterium]
MSWRLRFRQVHLDFHTSPEIPGIGADFDKRKYQEVLREAAVDSVTTFATCHHGWSYFNTKTGERHPHLQFDLLRAQMDACKEIDINVPVYITAGVHNMMARKNPQWREINVDGQYGGWAKKPLTAGFHKMCFNTPYLDFLCTHIEEVVELFPEADGIFLDIISQGQCCCPWCLEGMLENGLNPEVESDRAEWSRKVLDKYYRRTTKAVRSRNPQMPVFHNSGHIRRGERGILEHFSHLEIESLPTGGWGYDHFPMSAKYCATLGLDMLGMTGKFHTTWGEFGGYKHPNALRYECAAMTAFGSKCSVGDQLHPCAVLDKSTYEIIGAAYREVREKERFCEGTTNVADVAVLSSEAVNGKSSRDNHADVGACRVLLEGHFLFDVIDSEPDFNQYKMLIVPDDVSISDKLKEKLDSYLSQGGKLFISGKSILGPRTAKPLFDVGAEFEGENALCPDFILPTETLRPEFVGSPMVMYLPSQRIKVSDGESIGQVFDPYFNRSFRHFCSHQHTPPKPSPSGYDCGVRKGNILYLAHPVFSIYRSLGSVACKDYIIRALRLLLGNDNSLAACNLPSTARVSLRRQEGSGLLVLHLLYAPTISRGGSVEIDNNPLDRLKQVEVIEDMPHLQGISISLKTGSDPANVSLQPQSEALSHDFSEGKTSFRIRQFSCHQMVVLEMK